MSEPVPIPACVHRFCGRLTAALVLALPLVLISPPAEAPTDRGLACLDPALFGQYDPLLGPWPVECMLLPYPEGTFSEPPAAPVASRSLLHRALTSFKNVAVTAYDYVDIGARLAHIWIWQLEPLIGPQLDLIAPPPSPDGTREALLLPDRFDDVFEHGGWIFGTGRVELRLNAADFEAAPVLPTPVWAHDTFLLSDQTATLNEHFAARTLPTYADIVLPYESLAVLAPRPTRLGPKRRVVDPTQLFLQMTAILFLATVILVPIGCSFAAGALYAHPRDGPHAERSASAKPSPLRSLPGVVFLLPQQPPHQQPHGQHADSSHDRVEHG